MQRSQLLQPYSPGLVRFLVSSGFIPQSFALRAYGITLVAWADPEGGQGVRPLKNHKNIDFLSNTGPDPHTNHKATKPAFNV